MKFSTAASFLMPAAAMAAAADFSAKIVGGSEAQAGEFPYIVSLSQSDTRSHFCGGVLLDSRTVLTAAHCSDKHPASKVLVRAGSNLWASGGKQVTVASIKVHPKYDGHNNDIAVWSLAQPLEQGEAIKYATLPTAGSDPAANTSTTVAGWGLVANGGTQLPQELRKVNVPVVSRAVCSASYGRNDTQVTPQMFCAGSPGRDSCNGDSGGPIVDSASGTLLGLVSWGFDCAHPEYPGVYTNVGQFIDFIHGAGNKTGRYLLQRRRVPYWV